MKAQAAVLLVLLSIPLSGRGAERYLWPLDTPRRLSSTFGEYREGHYHAGIDVRCFGQIGLPCRAVGTSVAVRLRISPAGYGKALYLRHADGREIVYAHLSGFNRALDSLAYEWRVEHETSWCDLDLKAANMRFNRGSIVAYTGSSGSPHPHLHFEMRDSAGKPFNPLQSLYVVPDSYAPIMVALEVVPLTWGSMVDGSPLSLTKKFRFLHGNDYGIGDTLQLDGEFGFGVLVWDRQGHGSYRMAPYTVALSIDGAPAYHVLNGRLDYSRIGDVVFEYDEIDGAAPGRYLLLFRKPGNSMEGREGIGAIGAAPVGAGARELIPLRYGYHTAEIVARDANGNTAKAMFPFFFHRYPVLEAARAPGLTNTVEIHAFDPDGGAVATSLDVSLDGGKNWSGCALGTGEGGVRTAVCAASTAIFRCAVVDDEGARIERTFAFPDRRADTDSVSAECRFEVVSDGVIARITTDRILASVPSVRLLSGISRDSCRVFQIGQKEFVALIHAGSLANGINLLSIRGTEHQGSALDRTCPFRALVLKPGERSSCRIADSTSVWLRSQSVGGPVPVLVAEAGARRESLDLVPVARAFTLEFPLDRVSRPLLCGVEGAGDAGVYRWGGRAGWKCVGIPGREGTPAEIRRPGTYALFGDVRPPELHGLSRSRRVGGSGFFKRTLYFLPIREGGSGVDPSSIAAVLDGKRVVCEWDEYRRRLDIPIPASHPRGPAELAVELSDRAGNRVTGRCAFVIE